MILCLIVPMADGLVHLVCNNLPEGNVPYGSSPTKVLSISCYLCISMSAMWGPSDACCFLNPMTSTVKSTINHSYWSYKPM